jgi:DNA-binding transcriptional LysR family regulator
MTLDQLQVLVKVVQSGSFTRAAELLGSSKGYLSRVLAQLESELGAKLLERTTRRLAVTETGREVFERALGILAAVEDTQRVAADAQGEPRGTLRLTCGVEFGAIAVNGWAREYLETYPQVAIDMEHTSRVIDLVHEGFDLAIRIGPLPESRLVARPLGEIEYGLFACPRYLASHGTPSSVEALREHRLLMQSSGAHRQGWILRDAGDARTQTRIEGPARLRVNNNHALLDAMLHSLGIGQLPLLIAGPEVAAGRLAPVLAGWAAPSSPVHAVYPSGRYLAPKVRGFIDLALKRFPTSVEAARTATHCGDRPAG